MLKQIPHDMALNLGRRGEKPKTKLLSYGMVNPFYLGIKYICVSSRGS
jgi:hypothetical protein